MPHFAFLFIVQIKQFLFINTYKNEISIFKKNYSLRLLLVMAMIPGIFM